MAKRLSAAKRISRLQSEGYSRRQIAAATGYSTSTVGRIARGESKGEKILGALREFAGLGKKAKAEVVEGKRRVAQAKPAPPPRPVKAPPAPPRVPSALERAEGYLAGAERGGIEKVMIHVTSKSTGMSRTLFAKGGIDVDAIRGNLRGAMETQAARQGNNSNISDREIDWDDVAEIEFDEYY